MTNQIDPATYALLQERAQSQFKLAASYGDKNAEGIVLLMDNGMMIEGFSLARTSSHHPAVSAAQSALNVLKDLFGEAATQDETIRPGQKIVAAFLATAIANPHEEKQPRLKKPAARTIEDLMTYKGAADLKTITVVAPNTDLAASHPVVRLG